MVSPYKYTQQELEQIKRAEREASGGTTEAAPVQKFTGQSAVGTDPLQAQLESERAARDAAAEKEADLRFNRLNPRPEASREGFSELVEDAGGPARVPAFKGFQKKETQDAEGDSTGIAGRDTGRAADDWYSKLGQQPEGQGQDVGGLFAGTEAYAARVKGPEYKMSPDLENAYLRQKRGYEDLETAAKEFQQNPERARILGKAEEARGAYAAGEEERFGRTKDISKRSAALEGEAARIAGLKIDPEAMMGRGAARARTTLALSIANVLGNVGQAMQGKAATDAVLGVVRDMIAQNIGMQQQDRQFELQGLQARESALGRTAAALKDEGLAAKAVMAGQLDWYADQLKRIARPMEDKQALNVITQAIGKVEEASGQVKQQLMNATTAGQFQADMANAHMASSAANQRANARVERAKAMATAMGQGVSEGDARLMFEQVFKPARDAKLGQRYELLKEIEGFAKDPANRDAISSMSGWVTTLRRSIGKNADAGAVRDYIANMSAEQFSDSRQRRLFDLIRQYEASKMGGQAGKAITGIESFLYSPNQIFDAPSLARMVQDEHRYNLQEKRGLAAGLPALNSSAQRVAKATLENMYPEMLQAAPIAPEQPGPVRTPAR